jgi:hypothetical protein
MARLWLTNPIAVRGGMYKKPPCDDRARVKNTNASGLMICTGLTVRPLGIFARFASGKNCSIHLPDKYAGASADFSHHKRKLIIWRAEYCPASRSKRPRVPIRDRKLSQVVGVGSTTISLAHNGPERRQTGRGSLPQIVGRWRDRGRRARNCPTCDEGIPGPHHKPSAEGTFLSKNIRLKTRRS